MNRRTFNVIFLFIGFTLVGIILLQAMWLTNMADIRKHQLENDSQEALITAVSLLSRNENIDIVMDNVHSFLPDSVQWTEQRQSELNSGIDGNSDSVKTFFRRNLSIVSINGDDTIIQTQNEDEIGPDKSIQRRIIFQSNTDRKIRHRISNVDSLVRHMLVEIDMKSITDRVHIDTLVSLTNRELGGRGIQLNFEMAIINGDSLISSSPEFEYTTSEKIYEAKLFPDDIFEKNYKVVMYYPSGGTSGYVYAKMKFFLILTGLFTLGILIASFFTLRTIYHQKKLSEMKSDFINNMTHEFKTPIATSEIAIAALQEDQVKKDSEKVDYYTGILREENYRLNTQVEKVLQIAMLEKGMMQLNFHPVSLHQLLQDCLKSFELQLQDAQIQVQVSMNSREDNISVDPYHFANSLNNILDNAIKYNNSGGWIKVSTIQQGNEIIVEVMDNGKGMSPSTQKRAFERFFRGQGGVIHEVKGFGLGLSYARYIIESSNGRIELESKEKKGTTIRIIIPLNFQSG